jgi:hypothetical protein
LFDLPKVVSLVEAVKKEFGDPVRVVLGGGAFRTIKNLPDQLEGCLVGLDLNLVIVKTHSYSYVQ